MEELIQTTEMDVEACKASVLLIFADIDQQYLEDLAKEHSHDANAIIAAILDNQERGQQYPRRLNHRKRKHDDDQDGNGDRENQDSEVQDSDLEIKLRIDDPRYLDQMRSTEYKDMATLLISQDFPLVPKTTIRSKLLFHNGSSVFRTYVAMDTAVREWNHENPLWHDKKTPTRALPQYLATNIHNLDRAELSDDKCAALDEFMAARRVRAERDKEKASQEAEKRNLEEAREMGETTDCGCCCENFPLNRMVHCEGVQVHWLCRPCMKQQAETIIGYSKYEITCISMEGCDAGFSVEQKEAFLDKKLRTALNRIEAQDALEAAGIENLETCPFCPMAMEYPPVDENKEFRCTNPACEIVSCRLCRKNTHIPKTCAEAASDEGNSARHTIEEAMSEAIIRKCNKCANPYIKTDGCNKITCTRCRTLQCYVCRQTVKDYSHFDDKTRGGKPGQCPLFDQTEKRHHEEVRRAEEASRSQVVKDNPDLANEVLDLQVSSRVDEDERRRVGQGHPSHRALIQPPPFLQLGAAAGAVPDFQGAMNLHQRDYELLMNQVNILQRRRNEFLQREQELRRQRAHQRAQQIAAQQVREQEVRQQSAQDAELRSLAERQMQENIQQQGQPVQARIMVPAGDRAPEQLSRRIPHHLLEVYRNPQNNNVFMPMMIGADLNMLRRMAGPNALHPLVDDAFNDVRARVMGRIQDQMRHNLLAVQAAVGLPGRLPQFNRDAVAVINQGGRPQQAAQPNQAPPPANRFTPRV